MGCCCPKEAVYSQVSASDDGDLSVQIDDVTTAQTLAQVITTADCTPEEEEDSDGDDGDYSVDDVEYYVEYSPVRDEDARQSMRAQDKTRRSYEARLDRHAGDMTSKRDLICEYETFKTRHFADEGFVTAEALHGRARACQEPAQKKAFYRQAIMHTNNAEKRIALKQEYNAYWRTSA